VLMSMPMLARPTLVGAPISPAPLSHTFSWLATVKLALGGVVVIAAQAPICRRCRGDTLLRALVRGRQFGVMPKNEPRESIFPIVFVALIAVLMGGVVAWYFLTK